MPWVTGLGWFIWTLTLLAAMAFGMCVWAFATGKPKGPERPVRRTPQHSRAVGEGGTQRLTPPAPLEELPGLERDGGQAQRLPRREDLPWNNQGRT